MDTGELRHSSTATLLERMPRLTRRRFLGTSLAAATGLAGAALIGCSSGRGGTPSTAGASTKGAATTGAATTSGSNTIGAILGKEWNYKDATEVPKYGGTINVTQGNPQLPNLDPIQTSLAFPHYVASLSYSALMKVGREPNDRNAELVFPDLATSWEVSDQTKMVFKIRQGVKWQNVAPVNGRPLTPEDVKFAINRAATDQISNMKGVLRAIKNIETPDSSTVVINLKEFDPTLFLSLAGHFAWITPKELSDSKKITEAMIGTGPFIFQKWEQDARLHYKKNPDYFIKGAPFVDEINILQLQNAEARLAAHKSGQLHNHSLDIREWREIKDDKKFTTASWLTVSPSTVFMNFADPRFKDVRIRRALSLVIAPDVVIKILADGEGLWRGIMSAQNKGWALSQEELKSKKFYLRQDLQEAKQLMVAAGFPNGLPKFPFHYDTSGSKTANDVQQYIAEQMGKNGIGTVNMVAGDRPKVRKMQDEHTYDGLLYGSDGNPQAEMFLADLRTGGQKNGSAVSIPELDAKIDAMMQTVDKKARIAKAQDIEREALTQVYNIHFTDFTSYEGFTGNLKNFLNVPPHFYTQAPAAFAWLN